MARPGIQRGFTLIEVLVAVVVMAIMSLMAWQGVDGIVRTREISQTKLEQSLRLETVIAQWEQDLAMLQETGAVPALTCDGQTVRMTRRTDTGVQVVAWSLRPSSLGQQWQRWASVPTTTTGGLQDSWFATQQFQGNEPGQLRTLDGLQQWQVYFFRDNAWSNCQSSAGAQTAVPGAPAGPTAVQTQQPLPAGVRVVLDFGPQGGATGSLVRDTLVQP